MQGLSIIRTRAPCWNQCPMSKEDKESSTEEKLKYIYEEVEDQFYRLFSPDNQEKFVSMIDTVARRSKESFKFALDLIGELSTELTGVKSFRVVPKPPAELEVEIKFKKASSIKFKHIIAPLVEIESVQFGKQVSFGAMIETDKKALRVNITDGFSLVINLGPILGKHTVEIKGSGLLKRDNKKQVVLVTEVDVPGLDEPLEVVIPLRLIFHDLGKVL